MDSGSDHALSGEGPGTQSGGIARWASSTEQSGEGPVFHGGITGSVGSGKGVKRKRNLQTYEVRYKAIIEVEKGKKKKDVAAQFGIPVSTLSTWIKNKDNIKTKFLEADVGPQRKRDKKAKFPELESALLLWFRNARSKNIPLSGEIVKEKARQFAEQLQITDFECSTGWLDRFKDRYELTFKKVCGEANSVDSTSQSMTDWKTKLQTLLENYEADDIYNADETGLFFRLLPDKTLEFKDVKCHGGKMSKERLTVLVCANMTGSDKRPLLAIGKSKNPRCFKNLKRVPVEYDANKKAWETSEIFSTWVKKFDRAMTSQGRKVVLIVDNCPAHPDVPGFKATSLVFLPPNTTSVTEPMDQGVIQNFKNHYKKAVIQRQIRAMDASSDPQISILDALHMMKSAWGLVTSATIANCYRHAGFVQASQPQPETVEDDPEDDIPLAALKRLTAVSFEEYASADDNLEVCADLSDDDIISNVIAQRKPAAVAPADPVEADDDQDQPRPRRTIHDAMNGLDAVIDFLRQQGIGSETDCAIAKTSDLSAFLSRFYMWSVTCKQSQISDFFA